jgi:hypothetical protein
MSVILSIANGVPQELPESSYGGGGEPATADGTVH